MSGRTLLGRLWVRGIAIDVKMNPNDSPGFLVGRISHMLRTCMMADLREAGVTLSMEEVGALLLLEDAEVPLRVRDLAELLRRDPTTLNRQLARLIEDGLVKQGSDPNDGRVVLLSVTELGREVGARARPVTEALRSRALSGMPPEDLEVMVRCLKQFHTNLVEHSQRDSNGANPS